MTAFQSIDEVDSIPGQIIVVVDVVWVDSPVTIIHCEDIELFQTYIIFSFLQVAAGL